MKKRFFILAVMLTLALGLVACGEDSKSSEKLKEETTLELDEKKAETKDESEYIEDDVNEDQVDMYEGDEEAPAKEELAESYEEVIFEGPENINVQFYEIPEGTTKIATRAFESCHNLDQVTIPDSVKEIGNNAFAGTKLTSITLPEGLEIIGNEAFINTPIESIVIPDSVKVIGNNAFFNTYLAEVAIPSGVEELGSGAFGECQYLKKIVNNSKIVSEGMCYRCTQLETVQLVEGVTDIEGNAFSDCPALRSIVLPSSVKTIGHHAFAFQDPSNSGMLEEIIIPDGLESIGYCAFSGNNKLTITIPSSVTNIEELAFFEIGCVRVPQSILDRLGVREDGFRDAYAGSRFDDYQVAIEIIN